MLSSEFNVTLSPFAIVLHVLVMLWLKVLCLASYSTEVKKCFVCLNQFANFSEGSHDFSYSLLLLNLTSDMTWLGQAFKWLFCTLFPTHQSLESVLRHPADNRTQIRELGQTLIDGGVLDELISEKLEVFNARYDELSHQVRDSQPSFVLSWE